MTHHAKSERPQAGGAAATILLIDDCPHLVTALERALKNAGYDVLATSSSREGIEILQRRRVDLVVTDIEMPEVDGMDLLRFALREKLAMPFIAMSGGDWSMRRVRTIRTLGAVFALKKPLTAERLIGTVEAALDSARGSQHPGPHAPPAEPSRPEE